MKRKTEVEAFLFDGNLRKDKQWLIPEWALKAVEEGIIFWINPYNKGTDIPLQFDGDGPVFPDNIFIFSLFIRTEDGNVIEVDAVEKKYILYDFYGKIYPCNSKEFKKNYVEIAKNITLKRVDILPRFYKDDLFRIKGEWIYIPPESYIVNHERKRTNNPYYTIRCSNCGVGKRVKATKENSFSATIASWYFCQNCGAEMQNSDLPKRGE